MEQLHPSTIDIDAEFASMMAAEFGAQPPATETPEAQQTPLTAEEIDRQVAEFAAQLNGDTPLSDEDSDFLAANGMTMRQMTSEELAAVAANEEQARQAVRTALAAQQAHHEETIFRLYFDKDSESTENSGE